MCLAALHEPVWEQGLLSCGMATVVLQPCAQQHSQTAARHGLGDSTAQGLKNVLDAAVGDETAQVYGCTSVPPESQLCQFMNLGADNLGRLPRETPFCPGLASVQGGA